MKDSAFERARRVQAEAARLGFDWPTLQGVAEKIVEEAAELQSCVAGNPARAAVAEEMGDLLFVLVNLARRLELVPEQALHAACEKFERRFAFITTQLAERGLAPEQAGLDELERLWQLAKRIEDSGTGKLPEPL